MGCALAGIGGLALVAARFQRRLPPCVYDGALCFACGLAVVLRIRGLRALPSARGLTGRERESGFRAPGPRVRNSAPLRGEVPQNFDTSETGRRVKGKDGGCGEAWPFGTIGLPVIFVRGRSEREG